MASIQAIIQQEDKKYGVPDWITVPLVEAESSGKPGAVSSTGAVGLLQLEPTFPGAAGKDLTDPQQNLDTGLAVISRYIQQNPGVLNQDHLQAYKDVISHTGWDQTGGWAREGVGEPNDPTGAKTRARYVDSYTAFASSSAGDSHWWDQNPLGDAAGWLGNLPGQAGGAVKDKAGAVGQDVCRAGLSASPLGSLYAPFVCTVAGAIGGGISNEGTGYFSPWKLLVILVSLLILVSAAFHVMGKGADVVNVQASTAASVGRAGGRLKSLLPAAEMAA